MFEGVAQPSGYTEPLLHRFRARAKAEQAGLMPLYAIGGQQPTLGRDVWVAPSADVIGDARLGDEVGIWFGAVIRADNTAILVGARTNIQEGAMLHSDPHAPLTIGAGVTVGHHAILHGCTIGDNVLIGMGATVLNGAVIGADSLVGGSPARAVRALSPEAIRGLTLSADHYAARAKAYAAGLVRVDG